MQAESENFSEFSERTESLSDSTGCRLSDLPALIGISASMFHAYRSGKYPISAKAWRKLEAAERKAGIRPGEAKAEAAAAALANNPPADPSARAAQATRLLDLEEKALDPAWRPGTPAPSLKDTLDEPARYYIDQRLTQIELTLHALQTQVTRLRRELDL